MREADAWERRRKESLAGHVDPKAGKVSTQTRIVEWLEHRKATAHTTTHKAEPYLTKWIPRQIMALPLDRVTSGMIVDSMKQLVADGKAAKSVLRYRSTLGSFFAWAVERHIVTVSPVVGVKVPAGGRPREEMHPWTRTELEERFVVWQGFNPDMAEVARFLGLSGLRWSGARALAVADVSLVPFPAVSVQRARPEGAETKTTKSGRGRKVPLADDVMPYVMARMAGRGATELLFPPLHASRFRQQLKWSDTGQGRSIHDLRHTAVCIWLASGVKAGVVKSWAGHASLSTTDIYIHHLGSGADAEGLAQLNKASGVRGVAGAHAGHAMGGGRRSA